MAALFAAITSRVEWLGLAGSLLLVGLLLPSRSTHERRATERARQLALEECETRLNRFKAALTEQGGSIAKVLDLQKQLGLTDEEIGRSTALALRAGFEQEQFAAQVPTMAFRHSPDMNALSATACAPSSALSRTTNAGRTTRTVRFNLTADEAVFYSESVGGRVAAPWSKVVSVSREGSTLGIQRRDRQTPLLFDCESLGAALRAEFIGCRLLETRGAHRKMLVDKPGEHVPNAPRDIDEAPFDTTIELPGSGHFTVSIVGESHYQLTLRALAGDRRRQGEEVIFVAALVPEPTNPYDPNAVKVYANGLGHVGYLSRDDAAAFRPVTQLLEASRAAGLCRARLVGGTDDKPSIGVVLDLKDVRDLLAELPTETIVPSPVGHWAPQDRGDSSKGPRLSLEAEELSP